MRSSIQNVEKVIKDSLHAEGCVKVRSGENSAVVVALKYDKHHDAAFFRMRWHCVYYYSAIVLLLQGARHHSVDKVIYSIQRLRFWDG